MRHSSSSGADRSSSRRPFDHPETQITLLFGLPLPSLPPTVVREGDRAAPTSNTGRAAAARTTLAGAAQELLGSGQRVIGVEELAQATRLSVVTIRKHLPAVAGRLGLRLVQHRRLVTLPRGGQRAYERWVLVCRGRWVLPAEGQAGRGELEEVQGGMDYARNMDSPTRVIRHSHASQRSYRRGHRSRRHRGRTRQTRPFQDGSAADSEATEGGGNGVEQ